MGYARILKDNNGKPSGYRECDGEIAYMPKQQSYENIFRRVKIDIDTMEVLNHDFIRDKQRVYRKGILLRGIMPEGFHVYNAAYTGNCQVIYTPYGDAKVAHPASFEVLDDGIGKYGAEGYGRDEEFVYYFTYSTDTPHAVRIKGCKNPVAFTVLSDGYTKDDRYVYYGQAIVKMAIPQAFAILGDGYARDDKHIFWRNKLLKAEMRFFKVWGNGYACDEKRVFYQDRQVDADIDSFQISEEEDCAEDRYQVFCRGVAVGKNSGVGSYPVTSSVS